MCPGNYSVGLFIELKNISRYQIEMLSKESIKKKKSSPSKQYKNLLERCVENLRIRTSRRQPWPMGVSVKEDSRKEWFTNCASSPPIGAS